MRGMIFKYTYTISKIAPIRPWKLLQTNISRLKNQKDHSILFVDTYSR